VPETSHFVVVHHSDRLHEGVGNRWPDESKAVTLALFGQYLRFQGFREHVVMVCQSMIQWFAIHDLPQEGI
jgi:hypothetical protein